MFIKSNLIINPKEIKVLFQSLKNVCTRRCYFVVSSCQLKPKALEHNILLCKNNRILSTETPAFFLFWAPFGFDNAGSAEKTQLLWYLSGSAS